MSTLIELAVYRAYEYNITTGEVRKSDHASSMQVQPVKPFPLILSTIN